jgi:hypothetical protein
MAFAGARVRCHDAGIALLIKLDSGDTTGIPVYRPVSVPGVTLQ